MTRTLLIRRLIVGLAAAGSAALIAQHVIRQDADRDLYAGYRAAIAVRSGESMYHPLPRRGEPAQVMYWLYSPQAGAAVSLLPVGSLARFSAAWELILVASWWLFAWCLARLAGRAGLVPVVASAVLLTLVPGAALAVMLGNADPIVWACAGLAVALPAFAGPALALAAMLKTYTVWLVAAALARRDWRTVAGAGLTVVAATALALVVLGPSRLIAETRTWLFDVLPVLSSGTTLGGQLVATMGGRRIPTLAEHLPGNLSLTAALDLPQWPRLLVFVLVPLSVAWLGRQWTAGLHYAATLAAALLASPLVRLTYVPALLPLAVLLVRRPWRGGRDPRPQDTVVP